MTINHNPASFFFRWILPTTLLVCWQFHNSVQQTKLRCPQHKEDMMPEPCEWLHFLHIAGMWLTTELWWTDLMCESKGLFQIIDGSEGPLSVWSLFGCFQVFWYCNVFHLEFPSVMCRLICGFKNSQVILQGTALVMVCCWLEGTIVVVSGAVDVTRSPLVAQRNSPLQKAGRHTF